MLFIDNKYTRWYYAIIDKASRRINNPDDYLENHHIIPECFYINRKRPGPSGWLLGNPDEISNKVKLTPEEHRVCHLLLVKMTKGEARAKMSLAAYMIHTMSSSNQQRVTNKVYGRLKRLHSEAMSTLTKGVSKSEISNIKRSNSLKGRKKEPHEKTNKGKKMPQLTGDKNGFFGKTHSDEFKKLSSERLKGIPPAWIGKKKQCLYCLDEFDPGNYAHYHGEKCPAKFGLTVPNFREYNKRIRIKEKKIIIDNIVYKSLAEASLILSLKIATVHYRLNSKNFINYQYWSDDKTPSASLI